VTVETNRALIRRLSLQPELLRVIDPRKFEEVIAEIWQNFGYKVTLTSRTRDGGKDIYAAKNDLFGSVLYVIECKRYRENQRVGVELVRSLYGVTESEGATMGVLATTSFFTEPAHTFQRLVPFRLSLRDFRGLIDWLKMYR
jgi:restriction endonuclease Mrr